MLTLTPKTTIYTMSAAHAPAERIKSGDTVRFETLDCFGCQIKDEAQLVGGIDWNEINPATGPLFVEAAMPGDVLKVEILDIVLDDHGVIIDAPGEGVIGKALTQESTKIVPVTGGMVRFNERLIFPARPMIGVIGTAPAGDAVPNGTPGPHGGNMDCKRIGAGTTLYLPVNVEGALLAMGDMHALMGDGEVVVCGIEIAGTITVRVSVVKNCALPTPFLVAQDAFMSIFSSETVDEAGVGATLRMREFLIGRVGLEAHEAGMLLSVVGDLRICQVVDPEKTCRMEVPLMVAERYGYVFP